MSLCSLTKFCCLQSLTLAIIVGIMSSASHADDPIQPTVVKAADKEKKVVMTFLRKGGFAGFHDVLSVYSDFTFEKKGPRHRPKLGKKGTLSADQQATLKKLLTTYGEVQWSRSPPPNVADGMHEAITLSGTGKKTTLGPKDPEFRQIMKLAGEILRGAR